jgi:hypothetical protein
MRVATVRVAAACGSLLLLAGPSSALARHRAPNPLVEHVAFRLLGTQLSAATDGRYVALESPSGSVTLVDERTRASTAVSFPGCSDPSGVGLDGPWLAAGCPGPPWGSVYQSFQLDLYSLSTGQDRTAAPPLGDCVSDGDYGESGGTECSVGPAGADWLSWEENCWNCGSQSGIVWLGSGPQTVFSVPVTSATTAIDYNSPTLETSVCSPLRSTRNNHLLIDAWGQFLSGDVGSPLGRFALAYIPSGRSGIVGAALEHCGSRIRRTLPWVPTTGNPRELLSYSIGGTIHGLFLPSMRSFVIHVPAAMLAPNGATGPGVLDQVMLSNRDLYIVGKGGQLWEGVAPAR